VCLSFLVWPHASFSLRFFLPLHFAFMGLGHQRTAMMSRGVSRTVKRARNSFRRRKHILRREKREQQMRPCEECSLHFAFQVISWIKWCDNLRFKSFVIALEIFFVRHARYFTLVFFLFKWNDCLNLHFYYLQLKHVFAKIYFNEFFRI